jgi:Protein of unknown function (DUF2794)
MSLDDPSLYRPIRPPKIWFERREFDIIMTLYGRGQMAGEWRDYAIDDGPECVSFSMFRRASERPLYQIEKRPALASRQGQWCVLGAAGQVLKRGHDLKATLEVLERKLLRLVGGSNFGGSN